MKMWVPEVVSEHNYRATGSANPGKTSNKKCRHLLNKFKTNLITTPLLCPTGITYVDWRDEVEMSDEYKQQHDYVMTLFRNNKQFQNDIICLTDNALRSLWEVKRGKRESETLYLRESANGDDDKMPDSCQPDTPKKSDLNQDEENKTGHLAGHPSISKDHYDVMEGANYMLKELAFLFSVPSIYGGYDKYVFVYHKRWPVLENMFNGIYDNKVRTCMGFVVLE